MIERFFENTRKEIHEKLTSLGLVPSKGLTFYYIPGSDIYYSALFQTWARRVVLNKPLNAYLEKDLKIDEVIELCPEEFRNVLIYNLDWFV